MVITCKPAALASWIAAHPTLELPPQIRIVEAPAARFEASSRPSVDSGRAKLSCVKRAVAAVQIPTGSTTAEVKAIPSGIRAASIEDNTVYS